MPTHIKSLREFLLALESCGELQRISAPVDRDLEIGAICRRCYETGAAAPLFENIRGQAEGMRVLGAPGGVSHRPGQKLARIALAVGLPHTAHGREIVEHIAAARGRPGIAPRLVSSGPCKEIIERGDAIDAIDATRLPAPLLHDGDGGRYLNTVGIICVETPDKRWRNWSIARIMLVDKTRLAGIIAPNQHLGMIRAEWTKLGKPMPFALSLGGEPVLPYVGGMPIPAEMDEAMLAGEIVGEPIDVVQCETVDLQVPATSEIVVEGHVSLTDTAPEGPMGEYAGYLWTGQPSPKPVYQISAITRQRNAILPISVAGEPPEENHTAWGMPNAAEIVYQLRQAKLPVATAWTPFESANHLFVISVQRDWRSQFPGVGSREMCRRIGEALFKTKATMGTPKYLVIRDDVDLTNLAELFWGWMTRQHPGSNGTVIFDDQDTNPLVAYLTTSEKQHFRTTKVVYDALDPDHLNNVMPKRSSFRGAYSAALQEQVLSRWSEYGFAAV